MARAFYRVHFPGSPYDFADAGVRSKLVQGPCAACGYGLCRWEKPLVIEWVKWSKDSPVDVAGDFIPLLAGGGDKHMLVSDRVRHALDPRFQGLEFEPAIVEPSKKRKGTRKSSGPLLPGGGPVWGLEPTIIVPMSQEEYHWQEEKPCTDCGNVILKVPSHFELKEEDLQGHHLFRIQLKPAHIYLTQELKEFIMRQWFTNITTEHAGIIEHAAVLVEERRRRRELLLKSQST